ncbi:MAG: tRNA pseudouridine(55) synthase TruB [Clostridia bacterium]|nr:tRNA pseudouridine(55) synthase TruB [Clostridia bacterium]
MLNGILNVVKPAGLTSSDVVVRVRRLCNGERTGHMGTLDPGACGVLVVGVGKSSRLFDYMLNKNKEYIARFRFGKTTDTLDSYGKVTEESSVLPKREEVLAALPALTGEIEQVPPQYSALKIGGRKACDMARRGEAVEIPTRKVTVSEFLLVEQTEEDEFLFRIRCSSGTYIRSLCRDLASALGTVGYMSALIRTQAGAFRVEEGVTLEALQDYGVAHFLIPPEVILADMQVFEVPETFYDRLRNGVSYATERVGSFAVYCRGELFGIGEASEGKLKIKTFLKDD